jgi:Protein of unknown function (DUF2971)
MSDATELLAHYTTAAVAMEHVIPAGKLRMSPNRHMRDPIENRYRQPGIPVPMEGPTPSRETLKGLWDQVTEVRDSCRVLSFTRDATDPDIAGDTFGACWSRPRMWEQYGDVLRGVCLVFDQRRLESAIRNAFASPDSMYPAAVEYARSGIAGSAADTLTDAKVYSHEPERRHAVEAYVRVNYRAFFFLKHDDFETEHGYRVTSRAAPPCRSDSECVPAVHGPPRLRWLNTRAGPPRADCHGKFGVSLLDQRSVESSGGPIPGVGRELWARPRAADAAGQLRAAASMRRTSTSTRSTIPVSLR